MGEGSIVEDSWRAFKVLRVGSCDKMGSLLTVSILLDGRPLSAAAAIFWYDGLGSPSQSRSFGQPLASRINDPWRRSRPGRPHLAPGSASTSNRDQCGWVLCCSALTSLRGFGRRGPLGSPCGPLRVPNNFRRCMIMLDFSLLAHGPVALN
jgi:hypothetical protein